MGCFLNQDEPFGSLDVATQPPLINQHISHTQQHPFANHSKLLLSFARRPLPPSSHPTHIHTFHTAHIMHHHHHHHSTTTTSSRSTMQYPGTDLLSTSQDMLTSLDRSAMALNMIAHTLENEFEERFGHTGVRSAAQFPRACGNSSAEVLGNNPQRCPCSHACCCLLQPTHIHAGQPS